MLVDRVRELIPAVRSTRRGSTIILRHNGAEVTIVNDRGSYWVRHVGAVGSGIHDRDRHDLHTAHTMARSICGMLDDKLSGPD